MNKFQHVGTLKYDKVLMHTDTPIQRVGNIIGE